MHFFFATAFGLLGILIFLRPFLVEQEIRNLYSLHFLPTIQVYGGYGKTNASQLTFMWILEGVFLFRFASLWLSPSEWSVGWINSTLVPVGCMEDIQVQDTSTTPLSVMNRNAHCRKKEKDGRSKGGSWVSKNNSHQFCDCHNNCARVTFNCARVTFR